MSRLLRRGVTALEGTVTNDEERLVTVEADVEGIFDNFTFGFHYSF